MPAPGTKPASGEEADDLNQPLLAKSVTGFAAGSVAPIARIAGGALSGLKPAEDGNGLILRVYEPAGGRGEVMVGPPAGWRAAAVTIMEEPRSARRTRYHPAVRGAQLAADALGRLDEAAVKR